MYFETISKQRKHLRNTEYTFTFINYVCTLKVINWYGMALPYQILYLVWQLSHLFRCPCLMLLKIEAYTHTVLAYCGICMGASLKYRWQLEWRQWCCCSWQRRFISTSLRAVIIVSLLKLRLYDISDHYCVGYVRSSQRPRMAVPGKP